MQPRVVGGLTAIAMSILACATSSGQLTRDELVLRDRDLFMNSVHWIYGNLEEGVERARRANKPLFVVFRCIPCDACSKFDEDVAERDPKVRDLLDQYVCVRIPRANDLDLARFQFDFDQSWTAFLMHPDGTIYARYGTRSGRANEDDDISLEGLRKTLAAGLSLHKEYPANAAFVAGKQVREFRFRSPLEYPGLADNYRSEIDYDHQVARSCVHCHSIGEGERDVYRQDGMPIPDKVLFPYPHPKIFGLTMDPGELATVLAVAADSPASRDGFQPGDQIRSLDGQVILSTADIQWVLHHAPESGQLTAIVSREGKDEARTLTLPPHWRRGGDLSWRATTWSLRRMGLGGLFLERIPQENRPSGVSPEGMALRVVHAGEYGEHRVALDAGVRKEDVLVSFDGRTDDWTESELLAFALQQRRPGERVEIVLVRAGKRIPVVLRMQK